MTDHDQFFKTLIRTFFVEFFQLFFPTWVERFDFTRVEWLEKELFLDPPQGEKRSVDLLAKLPTLRPVTASDENWLALIHIEVESADSVAPLRRRMFAYYEQLRRHHDLPVLPIGLYLRVGLDGIDWDSYAETFWEHELVRFHYPYIGLPALDGEQYLQGENVLGVALTALMRVSAERRMEVARQALRRVIQCPLDDYRRHLLSACVSTYSPLDVDQARAVKTALLNELEPEVRAMSMGWFNKWEAIGERKVLLKLLESRFSPLPEQVRQRVDQLSPDDVDKLVEGVLTAKSLADLGLESVPAPT